MATFASIPYTYMPTAPRLKRTNPQRKPAPKPPSTPVKAQHIKSSSTSLSTLRPTAVAAVDDNGCYRSRVRETSTVHGGSDKGSDDENDDNRDLHIEELLFTKLQEQGFAAADPNLGHGEQGIEEAATEQRSHSLDHNGSALGDNLGGTPEDPILLEGDGDSSASEAEVNDNCLRADSTATVESFLDSPKTAIDSTAPGLPNSDVWHNNLLETAQPLRHSEQKPSTSDSMRPHTSSSSCASSEPLHNHTSAAGQCTVSASPEATMFSSARCYQPSLCARASPENQLVHDHHHPYTSRSLAGEHELEVSSSTLDKDPVNEEKSQQQELEQRNNRPQQGVNDLTEVATTESVNDTHLSDEDGSPKPALSPHCDPLLLSCHDEAGVRSDSDSDNDKADLEYDDGEPKRKRPSSYHDGPMQKKRKHHSQQRSTRQQRPHSKLYRHSSKSYSSPDQASRVTVVSSVKGRLPSPAPSAPQIIDKEIPSNGCNLGLLSSDILPTLTEVTFRPYSQHCCSFTAVVQEGCDGQGVSFTQLAQLIESIGHVGKIDDFIIKPLQQHSFLLTGFSRHTSSRLLSSGTTVMTVAGINRAHNDAMQSQPRYGRAVDAAGAVARGSEPSSSDHDGGLSDSDPGSSSDDDGCSRKIKQGRPSTRKNIPWDPLDEQRLLAYEKEDKSWNWIFRKFPGRTKNAVRTRLNIVRPGGRRAMAKAGANSLAEEKKPRGRPRGCKDKAKC